MSILSKLHQSAAEHHEHAARHHREAAKLHEVKDVLAAADQAHMATDHQVHAIIIVGDVARSVREGVNRGKRSEIASGLHEDPSRHLTVTFEADHDEMVMVRDIAQLFVAGPPVVRHAMGYDITKEELGGWHIHCRNGSVDNLAESEEEATSMTKRFLSYLPSSVYEAPPVLAPDPAEFYRHRTG